MDSTSMSETIGGNTPGAALLLPICPLGTNSLPGTPPTPQCGAQGSGKAIQFPRFRQKIGTWTGLGGFQSPHSFPYTLSACGLRVKGMHFHRGLGTNLVKGGMCRPVFTKESAVKTRAGYRGTGVEGELRLPTVPGSQVHSERRPQGRTRGGQGTKWGTWFKMG